MKKPFHMPDFTVLTYEQRGPIALITMNRPQALNALDMELFTQLRYALMKAQMEPEVQVAIVTGAGRAFCAGADMKSVVEHHTTEEMRWVGAHEYAAAADDLYRQIAEMGKVVIAMVNGIAFAGGMVLAGCADIAVASDRARFRVPEGLVGIADQLSTTWLQASVGMARAKMMVLAAMEIDAAEAMQMGLIAKVVPHDQLWDATMDMATRVMRTAPTARSLFKQLLNDRVPRIQQRHIVESHLNDESREGATAFAQKRPPSWSPDV